jgi:hypothetical protein
MGAIAPHLDGALEDSSGVVPEEGSGAVEIMLEGTPASAADHAGGQPGRLHLAGALLVDLAAQSSSEFEVPTGSFASPDDACTGGLASDA